MKVSAMRTSSYIAKNDIPSDGLPVTITGWEYKNVAQEHEGEQLKCVLSFREHRKPFILNVTNAEIIQDNLGTDETDEWIGQSITLFYDMTVRFAGKKGGIRVRAVSPPPVATNQPPINYGYDDDIPA